jgi:hypothetical protein
MYSNNEKEIPMDLQTKLKIISFWGRHAYPEAQILRMVGEEAYAEHFGGANARQAEIKPSVAPSVVPSNEKEIPMDLQTKLDLINYLGRHRYSEEHTLEEAYAEHFGGANARQAEIKPSVAPSISPALGLGLFRAPQVQATEIKPSDAPSISPA